MKTSDFYYELPHELIAQSPLLKRDNSRLLVVDRNKNKSLDNYSFEHRHFNNIIDYLNAGDVLVLNETRVIPARLFARRHESGGNVEILLLKRLTDNQYQCLVKPGRKARKGQRLDFDLPNVHATIIDELEDGKRLIEFSYDGIWEEILDKLGTMPLPPYIEEELEDKERYQTVYAKIPGSSAAPTAGLHFTESLLEKIQQNGVTIAKVNLEVGLGTFRPVKVDDVENHIMHSERIIVDEATANTINQVKAKGGRIVAVGTTVCRTLESVSDDNGIIHPFEGETNIFIYPGYKFKAIDGLITNFHLPESTLIMLVSALASKELIMAAYKEAVDNKYRFFSFGDAMLII